MTVSQQLRYWGVGLGLLIVALWLLADALLPFVAGAAIAYFADPLADRLQARGVSRTLATVIITALAALAAIAAILVLLPLAIDQIRQMIERAPAYAAALESFVRGLAETYFAGGDGQAPMLQEALQSLRARAQEFSASLLKGAWSGGLAIIDFLGLVVITPVVAFYLLLDWDRMIAVIDGWLPRQHAPAIRRLAAEVDRVLAGFVRGQVTVCLILGGFYAAALIAIGLQFGLLIGVFAGLVSFIPFVGAILGGALSIGVALFQFWGDPVWIGAVAAVFAVGQAAEGNFLTPKLVGGSVGLHPVWLIFALAAFGSLMGFTGLLIAVPAAAVIGVLGRFGIEQYRASRLYLGPEAGGGDEE